MRFLYVRYCTLSEVRDYWRNKADGDAEQKMVAVHGSPYEPIPLILMLMVKIWFYVLIYLFLCFSFHFGLDVL
jgi:hypothetical protein